MVAEFNDLEDELLEAQKRFEAARDAYVRTVQEGGATATRLRWYELLEARARTLLEVQRRYAEQCGGVLALPTP